MARRKKTRTKNPAAEERVALRRFDVSTDRAERRLHDARDALGRLSAAADEYQRRDALVDVIENLMDASYNLGLSEGHLLHAGRREPLRVPRFKQVAQMFSETWEGARARRAPNFTDRGRAALAAGTTAAAAAILGGVLLGPAGAIAGSVAGGGIGPYLFMREMRGPEDLGDAVLGGGVGGLFTPLGAAVGAYMAGDELARAANPMATADEMRDAIEKWLKRKKLWSREMSFWTPDQWEESEYGRERTKAWRDAVGFEPVASGFVVLTEGTRFGHALAYGDSGGDVGIYRGWEKLLEDNGWWWDSLASWAYHVYPSAATLSRSANPLRRRNGWIGDSRAVEHYLSVVGADRDADGRYLIGGDPPIYGMGGEEVVLSEAVVYYVDGRPVPLAAGLAETSAGVPVRVFNPKRAPNMDPDAAVERLNDAIAEEDWEEAEHAWSDLLEWVARGGFMPESAIELSDDAAYEWMEEGELPESDLETIQAFNREVVKERLTR